MTSCVNTEHRVTSQCCSAVQNTKTPQTCENCFGPFDFMSQWRKVTRGLCPMLADCFADCACSGEAWWSGQVPKFRFIFLHSHHIQRKDYSGWTTENFNQTHVRTLKNPILSNGTGVTEWMAHTECRWLLTSCLKNRHDCCGVFHDVGRSHLQIRWSLRPVIVSLGINDHWRRLLFEIC